MEDSLSLHTAAIKIQCLWRGYSTRKVLKEVYSWYSDVVSSVDGGNAESTPSSLNSRKAKLFHLCRPCTRNMHTFSMPINSLNETLASELSEDCHDKYEDTFINSSKSTNKSSLDIGCSNDKTATELLETKRNIAMELVWIQQAIESRKSYLQIKQQLTK